MSTARALVGCSGYRYAQWRGVLYPPGLPEARWLPRYAERFDTVELNATFYRLPSEDTVRRWAGRAPRGFVFAAKLSRYGTHMKRLLDAEEWLPAFLGRIELLGAALGPVLVQLPPRMRPDPERLARFLEVAPRRHRWAVEFRDPRWLTPRVLGILRDAGAALCVHDLLPGHPREVTAGWVYLRFHGPRAGQPYTGSYSSQAITGAARRIRRHLGEGRDAYAYFNNDADGDAVRDALALRGRLGLPAGPAGGHR